MLESKKKYVPLDSQVGGHPGVMASEDGSLVIKACQPLERDFYQLVSSQESGLDRLAPFLPTFYGTLKLQGKVAQGKNGDTIDQAKPEEQTDKYVLENISHPFSKPNIIDIKLGTVLYDELVASPEKIEKSIQAAQTSTSAEAGIRLTGFQVFDYAQNTAVITPKAYGRALKVAELPDGIARFFALSPASEDQGPQGQGLPKPLLLPLLRGILDDIKELEDAFKSIELRMIAASLLIVYEADWTQARQGLEAFADANQHQINSDEEGDGDDDDSKLPPTPFVVKLIDFAHTRLTPGKGPDTGVLFGLNTVVRLLEGRIAQVENHP